MATDKTSSTGADRSPTQAEEAASSAINRSQGKLAVMVAFSGDGGVENMVTNLLHGFIDHGIEVDLLLLKARGRHMERIPEGVNVVRLNVATSLFALPAISRYLKSARPRAVLVAKDRASRIALLARLMTGADTRIVLRMGMHLSGSLTGKSVLRRWSRYLPVKWLYPLADRIVTVSEAVADDLMSISRIPRDRFTVIRNPSIPPDIENRAAEPLEHSWLQPHSEWPVVMGVGRLTDQKDFATLIRAFAKIRRQTNARLIILGEGSNRSRLEALAESLGIREDVDLPGFQPNPYAWLARASLFVLSSRYEGSPNVLVEAMALGIPVVATDCPSGPAEILDNGRIAALVPPGDASAMAAAMQRILERPADPCTLRNAVSDYTVSVSARHYLRVLGYQL